MDGRSQNDLYAQNLAALRQYRPHLAALVEAAAPDLSRYRLIQTNTAHPTLEVIGPDGVARLWHSRYDPLREAERELEAIDRDMPYVPLFAGIGLGYAARMLADRRPGDFFDMILLEEDTRVFHLAMQTVRLDDLFANPRVYIQLGDDLERWREIVLNALPGVMSCRLQLIRRRAALETSPDYYQSKLDVLTQRLQLAEAEFDLMIRSGRGIQENLWRNLPAIARSAGIEQTRGAWRGKPAIVVAAGPSLDKNVDQLAHASESCLIIVVDTALRTILSRGISPHMVVSTDASELNLKHFEDLTPPKETILAFDPELYWAIPSRWSGNLLYANLEKSAYTRWIERVCGPYGYMAKGISVGHTAFYLAREMGADPIILVGLDLAFDAAGGKTHASDAALHRAYAPIPSGARQVDLSERHASGPMQESVVWVPGALGGQVPTSHVMALYLRQFAEDARQTTARVIDATEGGAYIDGTEIHPLDDALRAHAGEKFFPGETIARLIVPICGGEQQIGRAHV